MTIISLLTRFHCWNFVKSIFTTIEIGDRKQQLNSGTEQFQVDLNDSCNEIPRGVLLSAPLTLTNKRRRELLASS